MKPISDCQLYTFVDVDYLRGRTAEGVARQLCEGGADIIQLRAKGASDDELRQMAATIEPITTSAGVHLVINDRLDIALALSRPFVHLGQEDFFETGRRHVDELAPPRTNADPTAQWNSGLRTGLSSHCPAEAKRAMAAGPDYLAIGPIFASPTKKDREPTTMEYVRWASEHVDIPWFAIGGITLENVDRVLAAGARRICVISAVLNTPDVASACHRFRERLRSATANRNHS